MKTFFAYVGAFFTFAALVGLLSFVQILVEPSCRKRRERRCERARRAAAKKAEQLRRREIESSLPKAEVRR